jgi:hypothetical protein
MLTRNTTNTRLLLPFPLFTYSHNTQIPLRARLDGAPVLGAVALTVLDLVHLGGELCRVAKGLAVRQAGSCVGGGSGGGGFGGFVGFGQPQALGRSVCHGALAGGGEALLLACFAGAAEDAGNDLDAAETGGG